MSDDRDLCKGCGVADLECHWCGHCRPCGALLEGLIDECDECRAHILVRQWNERHPPGTPVEVTHDFGVKSQTTTTSVAWLDGACNPLVLLESRRGGYLLTRVKPLARGAH